MKVLVAGYQGKMGKEAVKAIKNVGFEVVGVGSDDDLLNAIKSTHPDVMVDLTTPEQVAAHTRMAIEHNLPIVVGATGLKSSDIDDLSALATHHKTGVIIAPNFSIGALLMMHCAQIAEHFYDDINIVEVHHPQKKDQPSGTALRTAAMLSKSATIQSRRQKGVIADQTVYFGGEGETFSVSHHTSDRTCFMAGLLFSIKKVMQLDCLVYGLDQLLFPNGASAPVDVF